MKITTEDVKQKIKELGGIVLKNFAYKNAKAKFKVKCKKCGRIWKTCWHCIQMGYWCRICAYGKKAEKRLRRYCKERHLGLKKNWHYEGATSKFKIRCKTCGHEWETCYNWLLHFRYGCIRCAGKLTTKKDVIVEVKKNKGKIVNKDWTYQNNNTKFNVRCKKGHEFSTCWAYLKAGNWCPYCKDSHSETKFREIIEQYFKVKFPTKKPKWLVFKGKRLELDGYNKECKVAFEYQGWQHYDLCYLNNYSKKELTRSQKRDEFKVKKCQEKDILLIVIPYWIPERKWNKIIQNKLKR